jgi:adenine deaminase
MPAAPVNIAQAAPRNIATGWLLATLGAIAFSARASIVKLVNRAGMEAVTPILYRMLIAGIFVSTRSGRSALSFGII